MTARGLENSFEGRSEGPGLISKIFLVLILSYCTRHASKRQDIKKTCLTNPLRDLYIYIHVMEYIHMYIYIICIEGYKYINININIYIYVCLFLYQNFYAHIYIYIYLYLYLGTQYSLSVLYI